jgi:molybdenum cofactor cytidylyltransferase
MRTGITAILLAAGNSRRFGAANKLLAQIGGQPLIRRAAEEIALSADVKVVVVTGYDRHSIERALSNLPLQFAHNVYWQTGMGSSIAVGIEALPPKIEGVMIVPGDMPFLTASVIKTLIDAFDKNSRTSIIFPVTAAGEQRNPVLWPRRFFSQLKSLEQAGGKALLARQSLDVHAVKFDDEIVFHDVDTQDEMATALTTMF